MNVSSNSVNRGRNKIERRRMIVKNLILQALNLWFTRVILYSLSSSFGFLSETISQALDSMPRRNRKFEIRNDTTIFSSSSSSTCLLSYPYRKRFDP